MPTRSTQHSQRRVCFAGAFLALVFLHCGSERIVYRHASLSGEIVVTESPGPVRTLRFGEHGAVQSQVFVGRPRELRVPYTATAVAALGAVDAPQRLLVVGLGGGSIPAFLHVALPDADIDVVEIDPAVVEVAQAWFGVRPDERLRVHTADGRDFIEAAPTRYDAVFLDAYGAHAVPPALSTLEFLEAVRAALAADGAVIANLWSDASDNLYPSMLATYRAVFPEVFVLPVARRTNRIVLALPASADADLARRLEDFAKAHGLAKALAGGLERFEGKTASAQILRDPE
ncbi:MAG: fused MFS/spermidine synthase [Acidobacteriota bacterium]